MDKQHPVSRENFDAPPAQSPSEYRRPPLRMIAPAKPIGTKPLPFKEIVIEFLPPSAAPTGVLMLLL